MSIKIPVKYPIGRLRSVASRKQFGAKYGYGACEYGTQEYSEPEEIAGIYRIRKYNGKKYNERMNFYPYIITHTAGQNAQRAKYTDGYTAWQALSDSEKSLYNKKARGLHYYGYHLFMKQFLKA